MRVFISQEVKCVMSFSKEHWTNKIGNPQEDRNMCLKYNKNINMKFFESSNKIQKTASGPHCAISNDESSQVTLNLLTMNARRLYYNLMDLYKGSINKRLFNFIPKWAQKAKYCLEKKVLDTKRLNSQNIPIDFKGPEVNYKWMMYGETF